MADDYDLKTLWGERRFRRLLRRIRSQAAKTGASKPVEKKAPERPKLSPAEIAQKVGELTQALIAASDAGERGKALKLAEESLALADIGLTNYNVACMHSLMGHTDLAFKHLEIAVAKGIAGRDMVELIEDDEDFAKIKGDPRFAKMLEKAGKKPTTVRRSVPAQKSVEFKWSVTVPKGRDRAAKAPLIVALHPFQGNMERTKERWKEAAEAVGAVLLTPQGRVDMDDGMFHWGRDLDRIEDDVLEAIDDVVDEYNIDEARIVLAGFSQGGWATWGLALRNPRLFRGIIPVCGNFAVESESQLAGDALKKMRVFIMLGADERDRVIDANEGLAKGLRGNGGKVRLKKYEGVGHGFPKNRTEELVKALRFVLE